MAEYYAVLKKAVSGLSVDSSDARRSVYEKARNALIGQLKAIDPPLTTSEISRQRLELEEAIRRVERESGTSYAAPPPPPQYDEPEPIDPEDLEFDLDINTPPPAAAGGRRQNSAQEAFRQEVQVAERQAPTPRAEKQSSRPRPPSGRGRQEPSFESDDSVRAPDVRARGANFDVSDDEISAPEPRGGKKKRGRADDRGGDRGYADTGAPARGSRLPSIILIVIILAVVGGLGALAYSQRDLLSDIVGSFAGSSGSSSSSETAAANEGSSSTASGETVRDVGSGAGISGPAESSSSGTESAALSPSETEPGVAIARRAILYEESRAKPGDVVASLDGSVTWKYVNSGPNGPVIEADLTIPQRQLSLVLTIRKNLDAEMPASHLVEITANAAQLPGGGIDAIPRLVMKPSEEQKGAALVGTPTKVVDGLYWIALAGGKDEAAANIATMRQSNWFDLPILYKSGQRAILTFEKGPQGQEAFDKAFAAWGN